MTAMCIDDRYVQTDWLRANRSAPLGRTWARAKKKIRNLAGIDDRYVQTDWLRANRSGSIGQNLGESQEEYSEPRWLLSTQRVRRYRSRRPEPRCAA